MTVLVSSLKGVKNNHKWQTNGAVMWRGRKADKYGVRGLACEAITGTGKTYFAMLCAKDWLKQHGASLARIVVVVPTEPLQKQWYLLFGQQNMANVSRQGGNNKYSGFAPIVVVIQNSLKRLEDHQNLVGKKVLYILDEAHRAASKTNLKLLKRIRHKQQMQGCIAISGSIERPDGNNIMDITGSDKDGEAHIKYGYRHAVADGVIPPFRIHVYETTDSDLTMAEDQQLRDYNKWIAIAYSKCLKNPSIHTSLLMSHLMDSYEEVQDYRKFTRLRKQFLNDLEVRYEIAESLMMEYSATGEKVALFHETIKGIERISQAAIESGLDKPFIYHSGETPDDIDECTSAELKRYKEYARNRKKILATWVSPLTEGGILLTCKALKEGLDVPEMDALVMLSHPNNPTPLIQATGRALRGNKNSDKQWVNRHGVVIDEDNPKNIYIVVQAGTTDANCIPNMQVKGDIPLERFVHYRRQGGVWTPTHDVVTPANDLLLDEPPIDDEPYNIDDEPPMDDYEEDEPPMDDYEEDEPPMDEDTPALEFNATTGEMQPATSAQQIGGIQYV